MAYVTQADLEKRYASMRWWTDDAAAGSVNAAIVTECITLAEGKVNQAAMQHYAVPLTLGNSAVAAAVKEVTGAIAGYYLASRVAPDNVPDNLREQYDDALAWLKELKEGKLHLEGETLAAVNRPSGLPVVLGEEIRVTRETMKGL